MTSDWLFLKLPPKKYYFTLIESNIGYHTFSESGLSVSLVCERPRRWLISYHFSLIIALRNTTKILRHALRAAQNDTGRKCLSIHSDTMASLLASILLTIVLFYSLAELVSLCHSEPANGRVEESLCYSLGRFVSLMV